MAKKAVLTFRTYYALALWNINIRREIENEKMIKSATTGEKASRRLFSLYIYTRENTKCSEAKKILAKKLLEMFDKDIANVKSELLSIRKKTRYLIKSNTNGNFFIEKNLNYNIGKNPTQVKINADLTAQVTAYARLYTIFDEIVELTYKKRMIGLINFDEYRQEISQHSKSLKYLMKKIISTTKQFFDVE